MGVDMSIGLKDAIRRREAEEEGGEKIEIEIPDDLPPDAKQLTLPQLKGVNKLLDTRLCKSEEWAKCVRMLMDCDKDSKVDKVEFMDNFSGAVVKDLMKGLNRR
eukprot:NODE_7138_length_471_cov_51.218009_g6320_i0.p2 GENE.NODE_7138_length_471_cov_51.218009_g6320_i0~~NODE_7138_length_471_cov_51.218009_g6320_i0.p2  ORF type:complete len:111 (-),score=56.27 NODE_7138_length_471_cov_51.218009_g6320_i0:139-450(-)